MKNNDERKKPPKIGFRRRINPWYSGMTRQEIVTDVAKTTGKWLAVTVLAFAYWLAMLLLFSVMLVNIWHVSIVQIFIYAGILCAVTSLVYAYMLIHRKLFY